MASFSLQKLCKFSLFTLFFIYMVTLAAAVQFKVGGDKGWTQPTGNDSETCNEWATRNRFHVGDFLYFKYSNDSVLVVNHTSYTDCSVSSPIFKFTDGDTVFEFDRYGFFYFISGEQGHCKAGQKLIVQVMVHPAAYSSPQPAPSTMEDGGPDDDGSGWDSFWGPPPQNSVMREYVAAETSRDDQTSPPNNLCKNSKQ